MVLPSRLVQQMVVVLKWRSKHIVHDKSKLQAQQLKEIAYFIAILPFWADNAVEPWQPLIILWPCVWHPDFIDHHTRSGQDHSASLKIHDPQDNAINKDPRVDQGTKTIQGSVMNKSTLRQLAEVASCWSSC